MPEQSEVLPNNVIGMAGVFWVASELSLRGWVSMPTLRNQKGVDIIASSTDKEVRTRFIEVQVKATQKATAKFWMLGAKTREDIPHRDSLFFVFVRPESKEKYARFEAFVVPSADVYASALEPKPEKHWQCSWYCEGQDRYKGLWPSAQEHVVAATA